MMKPFGAKAMFFSENAQKLTYDNVWVKKCFACGGLSSAAHQQLLYSSLFAKLEFCYFSLV
jgi:hypothetical protein